MVIGTTIKQVEGYHAFIPSLFPTKEVDFRRVFYNTTQEYHFLGFISRNTAIRNLEALVAAGFLQKRKTGRDNFFK